MDWKVVVRTARQRQGTKQAAFAHFLGVDQATVSRWECGKQIPAFSIRQKLLEMLPRDDWAPDSVAPRQGGDAVAPPALPSARDQLMAQAYAAAPIGLCCVTPELRFSMVNASLAALSGLSIDAHIDRRPADLLGELGLRLESICAWILRTGGAMTEMEISGTVAGDIDDIRTWSVNAQAVEGGDFNFAGLNIVIVDVTERKRSETALRAIQGPSRQREIKFRSALNASPLGFAIIKAVWSPRREIIDFAFTFANPAALQQLKRTAEELRRDGRLSQFRAQGGLGPLFAHYVRVLQTGHSHDIEYYCTTNGQRGYFHNIAVKLGEEVAIFFATSPNNAGRPRLCRL